MTAADRVTTVAAALQDWHTLQELAQALHCQKSWVRWGIQMIAQSRPVFSRKRNVLVREYRVFPEAVQVTRV